MGGSSSVNGNVNGGGGGGGGGSVGGSGSSSNGMFMDVQTPTADETSSNSTSNNFDYMSTGYDESVADVGENTEDEQKFRLFLLADKYGVSDLKALIRLHLTCDLLAVPPGPRLLRLIRFAFEELPGSTRSRAASLRMASGRDSGVGTMSDRGTPPATIGRAFGSSLAHAYSFCGDDGGSALSAVFGHGGADGSSSSSDLGVGVAMTTERRTFSRASAASSGLAAAARDDYGGIYGRDNETTLLRESITAYVADKFVDVGRLEGFEGLLRKGGEMGGFGKMVMECMARK